MNKNNNLLTYIELQQEAERAFGDLKENVKNVLELATMGHIFQLGFTYAGALAEQIYGLKINQELFDKEPHRAIGAYLPYEELIDSTTVEIFTSGFVGGYCFTNGIVFTDLAFS